MASVPRRSTLDHAPVEPWRTTHRSRRTASITIGLVLAVVAAACSADGRTTAAEDRPTLVPVEELARTDTVTEVLEGTVGRDRRADERIDGADDGHGSGPYEPTFDDLAGYPLEYTTTTVEATTASTAGAVPTSSPEASRAGGAPVTTAPSGGGADTGIYTGVVGRLGRDEAVIDADPPVPTAAPGVLPLTGLPGEVPNRPAAVVKIDNGGRARPQTGLNAADIVVEEEVEGGITRFAAIYHSTSSVVGPIRSARTTDIGIINGFGSPLLLYSGANAVTDALVRAQPTVENRSAATSSGYWRSPSRRAPSNLYSDTEPHWASAAGGPPPPQFAYRSDGDAVGGDEATSFSVAYRSTAGWSWDGSAWLRSQGGRAHLTASGARVSAANVVVVEVEQVATGMVDSSGSSVPEFVFVGSGPATVFTAGRRITGTWVRPTLASVPSLVAADGTLIELTPGRTWIQLVRVGRGPS